MAKILHIEDSPLDRALVRQVLEGAGYVVAEAVDGLQGIKAVSEEQPDLILIDIDVPGLNGYETATRIKSLAAFSHIPIIALTGSDAGTRERSLTAGCDGYLTKPLDVDQLPRHVSDFLGGRRENISDQERLFYLDEYKVQLVDRLEQKIQELTLANTALMRDAKMKSRFIDLAAHELRTPLAVVHGYVSLLSMPGNKFVQSADQNTLEIIDGIATGIDRLRGIVQDMLDVTRIEAHTLQLHHSPVVLPQLFSKIEKEFSQAVQRRHQTLLIGNTHHIPTIWADGERVIQILRNLISNAIKYTPDYGTIALGAQLLENYQLPGKSGQQPQDFIKITVSDTGVGIASEQQIQIFEHFYEVRELEHHSTSKTDFMGSGAGLGLPIARGVAEAHGGALSVESEGHDPEHCPGSSFHLILPVGNAMLSAS